MRGVDTEKISDILKNHSEVTFAGVFGSRARGQARTDSDLDLLIRVRKPLGLFRFIGLKHELSDALGIPVDLVSDRALSPLLRQYILKDLQTIYEGR